MDIVTSLVPIFGIIFLGMVAYYTGFLPTSLSLSLNQFTYRVALPCLVFNQLVKIKSGEFPSQLIWGSIVAIIITYIITYFIFVIIFRKTAQQSVILTLLATFYNAGFMGVPIVVLLFPGNAVVVAIGGLLTVLSSFILLFADGHLELVESDKDKQKVAIQKFFFSLIFNPIFSASVLGAIWNIADLPLPTPILTMATMLGATAAPCALFCIGMILASQLTSSDGFVKGWFVKHLPVHIVKLVIQPLIVYICLVILGMKGEYVGIIILLIAMPTGTVAYIIAEKHHVYTRDASLDIFVNTALSIITIPCIILLLRKLGVL